MGSRDGKDFDEPTFKFGADDEDDIGAMRGADSSRVGDFGGQQFARGGGFDTSSFFAAVVPPAVGPGGSSMAFGDFHGSAGHPQGTTVGWAAQQQQQQQQFFYDSVGTPQQHPPLQSVPLLPPSSSSPLFSQPNHWVPEPSSSADTNSNKATHAPDSSVSIGALPITLPPHSEEAAKALVVANALTTDSTAGSKGSRKRGGAKKSAGAVSAPLQNGTASPSPAATAPLDVVPAPTFSAEKGKGRKGGKGRPPKGGPPQAVAKPKAQSVLVARSEGGASQLTEIIYDPVSGKRGSREVKAPVVTSVIQARPAQVSPEATSIPIPRQNFTGTCNSCGGIGHRAKECQRAKPGPTTGAPVAKSTKSANETSGSAGAITAASGKSGSGKLASAQATDDKRAGGGGKGKAGGKAGASTGTSGPSTFKGKNFKSGNKGGAARPKLPASAPAAPGWDAPPVAPR